MNSKLKKLLIPLIFTAFVLLIQSCDLFDDDTNGQPAAIIQFEFKHKVGSKPLEFNKLIYTNAAGQKYSITRLEYFLSGFYFSGMGDMADDSVLKIDSVFYVNADKETSCKRTVEGLEETHLHKGYFTFGLAPDLNKSGAIKDTPEHAGMAWPENLGGGYHFLKLEGKFLDGQEEKPYKIHLGTLVNSSGTHKANFQIDSLMLHAQPVEEHTLLIPIIMNIENWFKDPEVFDFSKTSMTMMNHAAQALLIKNARKNVFTPGQATIVD